MAMPIGKKIEAELRRQGIQITVFAEKINCTRNNVYNIFKRKSINSELLNKIAGVLSVDTSFFYSEPKEYKIEHKPKISQDGQTPYEPEEQLALLKKLVVIMEENKKALEEKVQKQEEAIKDLQEQVRQLSKKEE